MAIIVGKSAVDAVSMVRPTMKGQTESDAASEAVEQALGDVFSGADTAGSQPAEKKKRQSKTKKS